MILGGIDLGFPNRLGSDSTCWLERRPAWMARPLSIDLRERAVAAVLKGGLSRHRAATQFGVAASTVINWVRRFQEKGSVAPGQMGGHKPKAIVGEHHAFLVQADQGTRVHPTRAGGRNRRARPQGRLS